MHITFYIAYINHDGNIVILDFLSRTEMLISSKQLRDKNFEVLAIWTESV